MCRESGGGAHLLAEEAGKREGGELAVVHAIGIDVADVDLDRGMILGRDQTVSGGAVVSGARDANCAAYHLRGM